MQLRMQRQQNVPLSTAVMLVMKSGLEAVALMLILKKVLKHKNRDLAFEHLHKFPTYQSQGLRSDALATKRIPKVVRLIRLLSRIYLKLCFAFLKANFTLLTNPAYLFDLGILTFWVSKFA